MLAMLHAVSAVLLVFTSHTLSHFNRVAPHHWPRDTIQGDAPDADTTSSGDSSGELVANVTLGALGAPNDEAPDQFHVRVAAKRQGRAFLDKTKAYQAIIDCSVNVALEPWLEPQQAYKFDDRRMGLGFAFTSSRPPAPRFETRSLLWTLFYLFAWWSTDSPGESFKWQELSVLAFNGPETRLGILQVYAIPIVEPNQLGQLDVDNATFSTNASAGNLTSFAMSAGTADHQSTETQLNTTTSELGTITVSVRVAFNRNTQPLCTAVQFWRALLQTIISLAPRDASSSIRIGISRHFTEGDFTFAVQSTSVEVGASDVFKVWIALRALQVLAHKMANADRDEQFKKFEASVATGTAESSRRGTRIVGKILFLPGNLIPDDAENRPWLSNGKLDNATVQAVE